MATLGREQITSAARRGLDGRFTSAAATLRRTTLWGLSRSEQAPFAAAVVAFFLILAVLTVLATVGSLLSGLLPQLGGGIAIGVLLGYLAMGRRSATPRADRTTSALAIRDARDEIARR